MDPFNDRERILQAPKFTLGLNEFFARPIQQRLLVLTAIEQAKGQPGRMGSACKSKQTIPLVPITFMVQHHRNSTTKLLVRGRDRARQNQGEHGKGKSRRDDQSEIYQSWRRMEAGDQSGGEKDL